MTKQELEPIMAAIAVVMKEFVASQVQPVTARCAALDARLARLEAGIAAANRGGA
jgi:hypothetical protein